MPNELSSISFMDLALIGKKKLGHPHPASNLVSDSNKGSEQQIHL